jgi:predicted transcriptional regulator
VTVESLQTARTQRYYFEDPEARAAAVKRGNNERLIFTIDEREALAQAYALLSRVVARQPEKFQLPDRDPTETHVIEILRAAGTWLPCSAVAARAEIPMRTARKILQKLTHVGIAEGRGKRGYRLAVFGDDQE